jgi:hypothetical protein
MSIGMLFMELVSVLFCCLPYSLLFILYEDVINNVINVTPLRA